MKAIVVVFFRTHEPAASEQQPGLCQTGRRAASAKLIAETQAPPFWTWFIKNPRSLRSTHRTT
jgi:hypothetical protein